MLTLIGIVLCGLVILGAGSLQARGGQASRSFRRGQFGQPETRLASGLGYTVLQPGQGPTALPGMLVRVHYTGYLKNGKVFDTSLPQGEPLSFVLGSGQVIDGWEQGVLGMQQGESRLLFVPSDLAYGSDGSGDIPPDADLYFEVEFLG